MNIEYVNFLFQGGANRHEFDAEDNTRQYEMYSNMSEEEFTKLLSDRNKLGELGHFCCITLMVKLQVLRYQGKYEEATELALNTYKDDGLIHLIFHIVEAPLSVSDYSNSIQQQLKSMLKLTEKEYELFKYSNKVFVEMHKENKL